EDHPALDCVYKLQVYAGVPRRKRSTGKATWPGRKQVFRRYDSAGRLEHDVLALETERLAGEPLLVPVLRGGRLVAPLPLLATARERAARDLERLPPGLASLERHAEYRVEVSAGVAELTRRVDERFE